MPPVIGKEKLSRDNLFAYRAMEVFMKQTVSNGSCLFFVMYIGNIGGGLEVKIHNVPRVAGIDSRGQGPFAII